MKSVLRSIGGVSGPALLSAALSVVLGLIIARTLGPEGQGRYTVVVTSVALVALAASLGIGPALRIESKPAPRPEQLAAYAAATLGLGLAAGILALGFVGATSDALAAGGLVTAILVLSYGVMLMIGQRSAEILQAYTLTHLSLLSQAIAVAGQLALFGACVALGRESLNLALVAAIAGSLAQAVYSIVIVRRRFGMWHPLVSRAGIGHLVRVGVPSIGMYVGLATMQRVDRLFLSDMSGAHATGVYSLSASLVETIRLVPTAAGQLLFALTAAAGALTLDARRIYRLMVPVLVGGAVLAFALAPLVTFLAGEEYRDSIGLLRWLILAEVFMGVALLDSRLIMGLGKLRVVGAAGIALLVLSLPTYYLLISQYGARGAAWASIGLYGVYAAALYLARRALEGQGNRAGGPLRRKDNRRAYYGRHRL